MSYRALGLLLLLSVCCGQRGIVEEAAKDPALEFSVVYPARWTVGRQCSVVIVARNTSKQVVGLPLRRGTSPNAFLDYHRDRRTQRGGWGVGRGAGVGFTVDDSDLVWLKPDEAVRHEVLVTPLLQGSVSLRVEVSASYNAGDEKRLKVDGKERRLWRGLWTDFKEVNIQAPHAMPEGKASGEWEDLVLAEKVLRVPTDAGIRHAIALTKTDLSQNAKEHLLTLALLAVGQGIGLSELPDLLKVLQTPQKKIFAAAAINQMLRNQGRLTEFREYHVLLVFGVSDAELAAITSFAQELSQSEIADVRSAGQSIQTTLEALTTAPPEQ